MIKSLIFQALQYDPTLLYSHLEELYYGIDIPVYTNASGSQSKGRKIMYSLWEVAS